MVVMFHNYKQILKLTKDEDITIDEDSLKDLISLLDGTPEGKKMFYRFNKKWHNFLDSLDKEDRLILLKMLIRIDFLYLFHM
jgi:hypothetical protein